MSWGDVSEATESARLVAWDGCHKIYLAMDETEEHWFAMYYSYVFRGTPEDMYRKALEWYDESCGLRFVSSVSHDAEDPNRGYTQLIPQEFS